MNLYTYHGYKSSGLGGIETLYRSLHNLALNKDWSVTEIYCNATKEYFTIDTQIQLHKIPEKLFTLPRIGVLLQSLYLVTYFLFRKNLKNSLFLCIDIRLLYFFPKKVLSNMNVIVIQHSKLELAYGRMATHILRNKHKYINFTVYTDTDKEKLLNMFSFMDENTIYTIPRGCKLTNLIEKNNIKESQFNLVTVGRIAKSKNLKEMLAVIDFLPKEYKLFVYGDGDKAEVNQFKDLINDRPSVYYKGPAVDVRNALSDKSIFLMTSSFEGYGQALIEARSQGLPIIVYDTFDALKTIVEDGYNGLVVEPHNREKFVHSIIKLTDDLNLYKKMSDNAILKAKETENEMINLKWDELFTFLCSRKIT